MTSFCQQGSRPFWLAGQVWVRKNGGKLAGDTICGLGLVRLWYFKDLQPSVKINNLCAFSAPRAEAVLWGRSGGMGVDELSWLNSWAVVRMPGEGTWVEGPPGGSLHLSDLLWPHAWHLGETVRHLCWRSWAGLCSDRKPPCAECLHFTITVTVLWGHLSRSESRGCLWAGDVSLQMIRSEMVAVTFNGGQRRLLTSAKLFCVL